jgi:serine/threonine-protein kinase
MATMALASGRARAWLTLAVAFTVTALPPSAARAQNAANQAAAEALFDEGRAAMNAHNYAVACPKLFESNRLDTGIGTSLYLADCYEQNGQTASAWAEFREAAALAVKNADPREKVARVRAKALEPRLARLVITVSPAARLPGLRVAREGHEVAPAVFGSSVPIDPGPHTVVVSAPDHRPQTLRVDIRLGPGEQTLDVPVLEEAPAAPPALPDAVAEPPPAAPTPPPPEPARFPVQRAIAVGAVVVGVGSVAAASYFGLQAKSELDDSNAGHCHANNACDPTGLTDRSSAQSSATASTVLFVVGGAALAGGVVLWLTAPRPAPSATPPPAALLVAPRAAPWIESDRTHGAVRGVVLSADF